MHRHDERDTVRATRWWARLAGTVAGLAGLGIAGIAAWFVAPTAGSPVPAVGELIINVLPGPLVNFGKDTLGTADKPVLLAIIVVAVLILCAIAGQLEWRRRFAGAAIFAVVAVLGMIGIAAQPDATVSGVRAGDRWARARLHALEHVDQQAAGMAITRGCNEGRRGAIRLAAKLPDLDHRGGRRSRTWQRLPASCSPAHHRLWIRRGRS